MIPKEDVIFIVEALPEDVPVRGNAVASGDEEFDRKVEDEILEAMEWNEWAWCLVRVTAIYEEWEGTDYLGCCSYESEEEFKAGGYWDDMKELAYADLCAAFERTKEIVQNVLAIDPNAG
jgi:hypothetical protein